MTAKGSLLAKRADELLTLAEKTSREISSSEQSIQGDIYIGSGETEALNNILHTSSNLINDHPKICYHLFHGDAESITERLDQGLLDFGILMQPIDQTKYTSITVPIQSAWGLLLPIDHPLAASNMIQPKDLFELPLIMPERIGLQKALSHWIKKDYHTLNIRATYNLAYNASLLVKNGYGCALLLDNLIEADDDPYVCFRPFTPTIEINFNLVWKKYRQFSNAAELFLTNLQEHFNHT